jgi:hypothetical protein
MDKVKINMVKLELFELIFQRFNGLFVGFFGCPPLFISGEKFSGYKLIFQWIIQQYGAGLRFALFVLQNFQHSVTSRKIMATYLHILHDISAKRMDSSVGGVGLGIL